MSVRLYSKQAFSHKAIRVSRHEDDGDDIGAPYEGIHAWLAHHNFLQMLALQGSTVVMHAGLAHQRMTLKIQVLQTIAEVTRWTIRRSFGPTPQLGCRLETTTVPYTAQIESLFMLLTQFG